MRQLLFAVVIAIASGCLSPTQVTLLLDTNVDCTKASPEAIKIYTGTVEDLTRDQAETTTAKCNPTVGRLVLVPSGKGARVGVKVTVATASDADCTEKANYKHCIVARRIVSFVPHTPLRLPISLNTSCIDMPCTPSSTCVDGRCVDANVDCTKVDCTVNDASIDAGMTPTRTVVSMAAGASSTCALLSDQSTWCWGNNALGQLAVSASAMETKPVITKLAKFKRVALSKKNSFGCGIDANDIVECWGNQGGGFLGDSFPSTPMNTSRSNPLPVANNNLATSLGVGGAHSCFTSPNGLAWCWGEPLVPEVYSRPVMSPWEVPGAVLPKGQPLMNVAAGDFFSCALVQSGPPYCWGVDANGEIGQGTTGKFSPTQIKTMGDFDLLSVGDHHACAAKSGTNQIACWGGNGNGECGQPGFGSVSIPAQIILPKPVTMLAAGGGFTCALLNGDVMCWGSETAGQLGNNVVASMSTPLLQPTGLSNMLGVVAGEAHACAWNAKEIRCWGQNIAGEIGDGTTTVRGTPTLVPGIP